MYRVTALNVTRIWIELAVWAAMVSTAQFSLSGSRLMPSPGSKSNSIDERGPFWGYGLLSSRKSVFSLCFRFTLSIHPPQQSD